MYISCNRTEYIAELQNSYITFELGVDESCNFTPSTRKCSIFHLFKPNETFNYKIFQDNSSDILRNKCLVKN